MVAASGLIAQRLAAQQLSGPSARSAEDVVRRLLAVQGQDPRGARLSIRSRSTGVTAGDVDDALTTRKSLLITWLNRGTLHLVTAEDYWWLHPLTTPQLVTGNARRLQQEGVSPAQTDHGVDVVAGAVESDGALTRTELRDRLNAAGVRAAPAPLERDEALTLLARRYLAGHGPADARDLAKWAGVPLRDARCGLDGISDELAHRDDGLIDLADRAPAAGLPPPRLLGAYEPLLLGWVSRDQVVGRHGQIVTTNGLFRPFALVGGRVVATWSLAAATVSIKALEPIAKKTLAALEADADDVLRFLGLADGRKSRRHAASR